jgi:hypothetical protein
MKTITNNLNTKKPIKNFNNYPTMRKIMSLTVILFTIIANSQTTTFKELESFKVQSINATQLSLKDNNYTYYTTKNGGTQWKAKDGSGTIGANGKGLVMLMTYNGVLQKKLVDEMKKSFYKYTGTSIDDDLKVVSFEKGKTTILTSSAPNPDNGKLLYCITIIERGIN